MKLNATHRAEGTKSFSEKILGSMLNNEDIASKARGISATKLLQMLNSKNISEGTKLILLGLMISEIIDKMKPLDFGVLFDKVLSQLTTCDRKNDNLHEETKSFVEKYKIKENEWLLVAEIFKGTALKEFPEKLKISKSNANKKIRALWQRLGLENREQLMFVAGWKRIISPDLACLSAEGE